MVAATVRAGIREVWYEAGEHATWMRIAEPAADPISEAELSVIWAEQRYPAGALATPDGRRVEVVFPGRKGGAAGPDFRDAVLRIEGQERRGDVELHVRASYFRTHGHHLDPAYDALALHVVYLADDGPYTALHSGGSTPVAAFAPWVQQRSADLQRWLAGPALWQEPCFDAVARHGPDAVREVLATAGSDRLEARTQRLRAEAARIGAGEVLWRALLDTLGHGGDREGFSRLSRAVSLALAQRIWSGGGGAGLAAGLDYVAGLADAPRELAAALPAPLHPALSGGTGRPANRPQRRLAAVAALLDRAQGDLESYATSTVAAGRQCSSPRCRLAGARAARSREGRRNRAQRRAAVGRPHARVRSEGPPSYGAKLPAQRAYGKTEFLERHLRHADGKRLVRTALEQQGLLATLGDWCSQGGCGRCPLSSPS